MPQTIAKTIGGKPYQFPRLTPHDVMAVEAQDLEERRKALLLDLDAAKVDPPARLSALQEFRKTEASRADDPITTYCRGVRGSIAIIDRSISHMDGDRPSVAEMQAFDGEELLIIFAARLAGLISDDAAKAANKRDDDDPVPTTGGPDKQPAVTG